MSKLISRNNIIKYKNPSQKIERDIHLTDDDLMLMGWQRLYYDNDPNHRQVKDDDPLRKTLDADESDWWVGDLLGNLVPKEAVLHYWNTKNAPASNATLEKRWEDEADRLNLLEIEKELQRRKNELFNKDVDTVFVKVPLTLLGLGIGGATALPYLAPGTIGGNIIGTTAFGEALNTAIKYGTGKTMGEHAVEAAHVLGIPQSLWGDFGIQMLGDMPLYVGGDLIGKAITNTGKTLGKEALNQIALNKSYFPTTKDLAEAINTEVKNKQFANLFPGQIGWAPRQTLTGYHASDKPIHEFNYWFPNWAVREHNAPYGIYFTANETRPSGGFLVKRPYIEQVTSTFDKPMIQIGEISTSAKNATRNSIERQALSMGADGIMYHGIKDNLLENQTIVKTLNPDLKVNVSEIIENDPYLVTKILDKDKIRLRLPTHTKDLPREIVLEPQGNNQYRIHIRTWNGDHIPANLDSKEKQALFESVYNELPKGAEILFPESSIDYPATRGTVAALMHLSRDPRFLRGNTTGTLIYTDKNGNLQTFTGSSFIKGLEPTTRLYRVTGTSGNFEPSLSGTGLYAGMWFTDSPTKPNRYALETWKKSNRTGEQNPLELQYIDIPNSQLERFRASSIADPRQVEFEPEDFIIPLDYPRLRIPYPIELYRGMDLLKLLRTNLSEYIPSNRKGGKLIPRKFQFGGYIDDAGKRISRFVDNSELLKKGEKSLSYLNYLSPTAVIGAVGRKLLGNKTKFNDLVLKGTGVVSQAFETENPLLALGINLGLDMLVDPFAGVTKLSKLNKLKKVSKLDSTTDFARITEKEALKFAELKSKGFENLTKSEKMQFQDLSVKLAGDFKYTGTKHSFKEIVNQDGTINFENASKILSEIEANILRPIPFKNITPLSEISNANKKRHIEAGTTDVLKHIAAVGEAAQSLGLTKSFTKQEFIFGALAHDIGKMITELEHIHGPVGAKLLQLIFPDTPKKIIDAVSNHMAKRTFVNDLQKAIHAADVANGKVTNIEELFSKYPNIQYESTLYFKPTFSKRSVTKDGKKEYKTVQDNLRTTAAKKGIIPRITTSEVDYNIIPNSSGETFRFADLNSEGVPLLTTKNGLMTNDDYMKQLRIDLEKSGAVDKSGVYIYKGRKYLAGVPIYDSKTILKIAKKINSNSSEIKKLRDAVKEGNSNAAHVLFNLKYATQHELTGIEMVGGGTFGKPILRGHRLTPGLISEMVDLWKQGYTGMIAPVIKGSANFLGRNEGFKALSQFGSKLFVSDSPLTALRYSDIRVLEKNTTRNMLLEGLSDKDRKSAEVLMDKILNYTKKYGIKLGDWDYSWLSKKNRKGTYENIKAELYEKHPKVLKKLVSMYDDLLHILGNKNLGVGGTRRGIALIKPNIVANDYKRRSYHSWLSKNHPFKEIFKGGDHNLWTELLNLLNIRLGMTANIGETYKDALEKGAPYGINYMIHPLDFIVSRYKSGKKLIPRNNINKS